MQVDSRNEHQVTTGLPTALEKWHHCWQLCLAEGLSEQTVMAAMVVELMPRLRSIYGPERAARLLHGLAVSITEEEN